MSLFQEDTKAKTLAHYVISHTDPEQLGATKLNKVMWKADVAHYRKYGRTISGQDYIRMPHGPVPDNMRAIVASLIDEHKIVERGKATPVGMRREFLWLSQASASDFSVEEIEEIHAAIQLICPMSADAASYETHGPLWHELSDGEPMSIRAAAVVPTELFPEDIQWALEQSAQ